MRDKYWAMYTELKHKEKYYLYYQQSSKFKDGVINGVCLVASCASIASWGIWSEYPVVWALIIALAQVIQAVKPLLPFSQQITALRFLNPELSSLLIDIDHSWDSVNRMDGSNPSDYDHVSGLIHDYEKRFDSLTSQFIGDTYFPTRRRCEKKAETECRNYFKHRYNVGE